MLKNLADVLDKTTALRVVVPQGQRITIFKTYTAVADYFGGWAVATGEDYLDVWALYESSHHMNSVKGGYIKVYDTLRRHHLYGEYAAWMIYIEP
jgi:hypothetical protein